MTRTVARTRAKFVAPFLILATVFLTGCPPEKDARDAIAGAHGYIVTAQAQWGDSCRADNTQLKCTTTNKLIQAQHVAADTLGVYCGGPSPTGVTYANGGTCVPVKTAESTLLAAVQNMNTLITDIKSLLAKEPK